MALRPCLPPNWTEVTAEAAWITVKHVAGDVTWSALKAGTNGDIYSAKAGVLVAGDIQPFVHYALVSPDASGADDTIVYGLGCNYYLKGPANKLTAEWTKADDDINSVDMITLQAAFGF